MISLEIVADIVVALVGRLVGIITLEVDIDQDGSSERGQKSYGQRDGYKLNESFNQGEYSNRGQSNYGSGGRNQHN